VRCDWRASSAGLSIFVTALPPRETNANEVLLGRSLPNDSQSVPNETRASRMAKSETDG
jgi:hypothetical protein